MRLGDLDALKAYLKDMNAEGGHVYYRKGVQDTIDVFFPQFIDDQPTVDLESLPAVRKLREELGKWKQEYGKLYAYAYSSTTKSESVSALTVLYALDQQIADKCDCYKNRYGKKDEGYVAALLAVRSMIRMYKLKLEKED